MVEGHPITETKVGLLLLSLVFLPACFLIPRANLFLQATLKNSYSSAGGIQKKGLPGFTSLLFFLSLIFLDMLSRPSFLLPASNDQCALSWALGEELEDPVANPV